MDRRKSAPKKKRARRGQHITRLLGLAVALLVVGLVLRKAARPFLLYYSEARSVHEVQRELRRVEEENRDLRKRRDYLASHAGAEIESRKLGWVRPGERNLVIERSPSGLSAAERKARDKSLMRRLGRRLGL